MSELPVPKFRIGDRVWMVTNACPVEIREKCPDCLGSGEWEITTPKGEKFPVRCGTCGIECWTDKGTGYQTRWTQQASLRCLTIGSVRIDTEDKEPVSYMCVETGVGSGSVWPESHLFADRATAESLVAFKTAEAQKEHDKRQAQLAAEEKRRVARKPPPEKLRIRELEKQVKELTVKLEKLNAAQ